MGLGAQICGPTGAPTLDVADLTGRVLGSLVTGASNGSVTGVAGFAAGTPFWSYNPFSGYGPVPQISVSGTTLSWTFPDTPGRSGVIVYGVR